MREPGFLKDYRVVVTTFFHIHEVKRHLPADAPPAVAMPVASSSWLDSAVRTLETMARILLRWLVFSSLSSRFK